MRDLAELMAERVYDVHERIQLERITHSLQSKTTMKPRTWSELSARQRTDWIETMREVLKDKQIMDVITRRGEL